MGHYLSEMDPHRKERAEARRQKRLKNRAKNIQRRIDEVGIAKVLAEIVENPSDFKIETE